MESQVTITEFLEARIEEDEKVANECLLPENLRPYGDPRIPPIKPEAWGDLADNYLGGDMGRFCKRFTPLRVLAECAAKRAIIELWEDPSDVDGTTADVDAGYTMGIEAAVKALAAVYSDHPEYQEEWA